MVWGGAHPQSRALAFSHVESDREGGQHTADLSQARDRPLTCYLLVLRTKAALEGLRIGFQLNSKSWFVDSIERASEIQMLSVPKWPAYSLPASEKEARAKRFC